jgi:hypothetical protein
MRLDPLIAHFASDGVTRPDLILARLDIADLNIY